MAGLNFILITRFIRDRFRYFYLLIIIILSACSEEKDAPLPEILTTDLTEITYTTAKSGGTVISDGGNSVTARGSCWSVNPDPTIIDNKSVDGSGGGTFVSLLSGLLPNTKYFVRAYATNSNGTAYGLSYVFTTQALNMPEIVTNAISKISYTSALGGGNVISNGGDPIIARGVCWSTAPTPTISNNKTMDGTTLGTFESSMTGLTPNTTYFVRAYATNSVGTSYGNEFSFKTYSLPSLTTGPVIMVVMSSTFVKGNVISDAGGERSVGLCWSTSPNPTIDNNKTSEIRYKGEFQDYISGLAPGVKYFVRAYYSNEFGTTYGNEISFTTTNFIPGPTDMDGNSYKAIQIGSQIWMAENLKTAKYSNGEAIPNIQESALWASQSTGAWSYYNNDIQYNNPYGKLYNWFAVTDNRKLCPSGWHIPSYSDFETLRLYLLGGSTTNTYMADLRMKEAGNEHWIIDYPQKATNESGFTGLPGGRKWNTGVFEGINYYGNYWTTTQSLTNVGSAESYSLHSTNGFSKTLKYGTGLSIRCLKD